MAQIIKHRRGNLEGLATATPRAGELLVVTGSTGLGTIANGDSLVFVGIDGSTATPVNKILQGTTVPDLTGGDYNTRVDGIPFFDTDDQKLYILNKGGNIEVKATPQTGGSGIVSGSSQVDADSITNFDSNVKSKLDADTVVSGSSQVAINSTSGTLTTLGTVTAGSVTAILPVGTLSGSVQVNADTITNFDSNVKSKLDSDGVISGSSQITITESQISDLVHYTDANVKTKLDSEGVISGSSQISADQTTGWAADVKVQLNASTVISGSGQLLNVATDFGSGRISGASIGDVAGTSTITGSFVGDGSGLTGLATTLTVNTADVDLLADDLDIVGTANEIEISTAKVGNDVTVTVGLPSDVTIGNDLTVAGNLTVSGTTTTVDSTTLNISGSIIRANYGGSAVNGGLEITDATGGGLATGSLLWDGTNDYWKGGAKGSEIQLASVSGTETLTNKTIGGAQLVNGSVANTKLANDGITIAGVDTSLGGTITASTIGLAIGTLVSGSSQINADSITNFDSNVLTKLDNVGVISGSSQVDADSITNFDSNVKTKLDADGVISGSLVSQLPVGTISGSTQVNADTITNFDSNVKTKLDADGVISGSSQISADQTPGWVADVKVQLDASTVISGSSQVNADTITNFDSNVKTKLDADSVVSGSAADVKTFLAIASSDISDLTHYADSDVVTVLNDNSVISGSGQLLNVATDFGTGRVSGDNFGDIGGSSTMTGSFVGDGSGLTGVASTLTFGNNDVSSNSTVDLKTQHIDFVGTANEIETSISGQTVTIGIPTNPTLSGNVTITGNLNVEGSTTTIDSTTVNIGDRILELNYAPGAGNAGLLVTDIDGSGTESGSLLWNSTDDNWMAGAAGSEKELARLNASPTSNTVLKADSNGLLVDSLITDDATNVTITGTAELRIAAATANSFVYFDSNKSLESVQASTAGDVIQWNGSSFVASREIDGGTF